MRAEDEGAGAGFIRPGGGERERNRNVLFSTYSKIIRHRGYVKCVCYQLGVGVAPGRPALRH